MLCAHAWPPYIVSRVSHLAFIHLYLSCVCCVSCVRIRSDDVTSLIIFNMRQKNVRAINSARISSLGDPFVKGERSRQHTAFTFDDIAVCELYAGEEKKKYARHGFKWKKQFRRTSCFKKRFIERETNAMKKKKTTGIQPLSQISVWNEMTSPRMRHHTVFPLRQQNVNRLRQCPSFHLNSVSWKLWYARVVCAELALRRQSSLLTVRHFVIARRVLNLIDNEFFEKKEQKKFLAGVSLSIWINLIS